MKLRQTKFCSAACGALSRIPPRFHRFSVKSYVFRIENNFKHLENKFKTDLAEDIDYFLLILINFLAIFWRTIFLQPTVRLPKWRHFVVVAEVNAGRHEKF